MSASLSSTWRIRSAGFRAFVMKIRASSFHSRKSIFSFFSSRTMVWTRLPLTPTQVPTASIPSSFAVTATLARYPGSRATAITRTCPSYTSGTSCSHNIAIRSGCVRDTTICSPVKELFTSKIRHRRESPRLYR